MLGTPGWAKKQTNRGFMMKQTNTKGFMMKTNKQTNLFLERLGRVEKKDCYDVTVARKNPRV